MASKGFYKSSVPPRLVHKITSPAQFWLDAPSPSSPLRRRAGRLQRVVVRSVEVWTTPCIVTCFGKATQANCDTLVNPGNPELSGVRNFPYFPRGGPVPTADHRHRQNDDSASSHGIARSWFRKRLAAFRSRNNSSTVEGPHRDWQPLGYVSSWGGMEVGSGMMYPVTVVDGLVHLHGGWTLHAEIALLKKLRAATTNLRSSSADPLLCPVGTAMTTSSGFRSALSRHYDRVVHTAPPFYLHDENPHKKLRRCYQSSLEEAFAETKLFGTAFTPRRRNVRAAVPLLGSGARGFPADAAMEAAAHAVAGAWLAPPASFSDPARVPNRVDDDDAFGATQDNPVRHTVAFGLLEDSWAEELSARLDRAFDALRT